QPLQVRLAWYPIKAADTDIDRMNRPPAEHLQQFIAVLLQSQPSFDLVGKSARQIDSAVGGEEVRRVQQMHVQYMTFDPFPAVEQTPEPANLRRNRHSQRLLQRMHRTHLIRDRTNTADAGGDVRHVFQRTIAQKRLEESGWFIDRQFDALDQVAPHPNVQSALAFDAGQSFVLDRAGLRRRGCVTHCGGSACSTRSLSWRNSGALALKFRSSGTSSLGRIRSARYCSERASQFACAAGPKHP